MAEQEKYYAYLNQMVRERKRVQAARGTQRKHEEKEAKRRDKDLCTTSDD
jgi:hypothetical protein